MAEAVEAAVEAVMPEMANRFLWAVTTGPGHPDATPEKAVAAIVAPLVERLGAVVPCDEAAVERAAEALYVDTTGGDWAGVGDGYREAVRASARLVLAAAGRAG